MRYHRLVVLLSGVALMCDLPVWIAAFSLVVGINSSVVLVYALLPESD